MKCSNCGKENPNGSTFCIECGENLGSTLSGSSNIENKLNKAYNYFSKKADLYECLYRLNNTINLTPAKYKILRIVICSSVLLESIPALIDSAKMIYLLILGIITGEYDSIPNDILGIPFVFLIDGVCAFLLFSHLKRVRTNHRIIANAKIQFSEIGKELYDYYIAYGNCPVSFENTDPEILGKLCEIAEGGRAFTVNDCLRVYAEDCYRLGLNSKQNDIVLNSVYTTYSY